MVHPGDVVTTKVETRVPKGSRGVVVSHFGNVVVMLDSGQCEMARSEVARSRDQTPLPPPMRFRLPYGLWTREDGGEVLFNREYRPLLIRDPGMPARIAAGTEWVPFVDQVWLYADHNPPWSHRASREACEDTLAAWGFAGWMGEGLPAAAMLRSMGLAQIGQATAPIHRRAEEAPCLTRL